MSTTTVVFDAQTGEFVRSVDGMTQSVGKAGSAVEAAKNKIVASFKMQVQAATEAGASAERLAALQTRAATQMASVTEGNAARVIASLDRITARQKAVQAEMANLGRVSIPASASGLFDAFAGGSKEIEQGTRALREMDEEAEYTASHLQKTSAAFRLLQGNISTNRRAGEAWLSQFGQISGVLETGFQVAGVVAVGAAIYEMGSKAYNAYQNIVNLTGAVEGLNDLQVSVDKGLSSTGDSIEEKIEDILSKNEGRGAALRQKLSYQSNKAIDLSGYFYNDTVKKLPDDIKGNYEQLYKQVAPQDVPDRLRKITDEVSKLKDALAFNESGQFGAAITKVGDFGAKDTRDPAAYMRARLQLAQQIQQQLEAQSNLHSANLQAISGDIGQADEQAAEKKAQAAKQAAAKYAAAMRENDARQRALWTEEDNQRKQAGTDSATVELNTWTQRRAALQKGSEQYRFADNEVTQKLAEARSQFAEQQRKAAEDAQRAARANRETEFDNWQNQGHHTAQQTADMRGIQLLEAQPGSENERDALRAYTQAQEQANKAAEDAAKARERSTQEQGKEAASYALASLAIQEQTGQVSRYDAAQQRANIHLQQYESQMASLRAELARQQALDPDSAGSIEAQAAITKAAADREVQIMQDAATTAAASWQGALKNANANWVQDADDSAKQVVEIYRQAVDGLNNDIASVMVGEKSNFAGTFRNIGKTLATDSLKHIEAPLLGTLGKPDGSSENPLWVRFKDSMKGGSGTQAALPIINMFGGDGSGFADAAATAADGSGDSDTPQQAGTGRQVLGGIFKAIATILPMFGGGRAVGGGVQAGVAYEVGEMGREMFVPKTDGTIIPHHALSDGAAHYSVQVANGVTPEQMAQHVQSALKAFHPVVVRDSVHAVHDVKRRGTASGR